MTLSELISDFRQKMSRLGIIMNPRNLTELKSYVKTQNLFFDISEHMGSFKTFICDRFSSISKTHRTYEDALKHVFTTMFDKIKETHETSADD